MINSPFVSRNPEVLRLAGEHDPAFVGDHDNLQVGQCACGTEKPQVVSRPMTTIGSGPSCANCGNITVLQGSCWLCQTCGNTTGCG